jgi:hypothetical protein
MEQDLGEAIAEKEIFDIGPDDDRAAALAHENVLGFAILLSCLLAAAEGP